MKKLRLENIASHTLIPGLVPEAAVVFDVGANIGEFSLAMIERFNCRCIAIEAYPSYFAQIPEAGAIMKFNYAIAGVTGHVELQIPQSERDFPTIHPLSRVAYADASFRVEAKSLSAFCTEFKCSRIDVLKLDIEGAEIEVLASCSDIFLAGIGQITVEFHEWAGVGTVQEVERIISRLQRLGFFAFNVTRTNYADVLFVNRTLLSKSQFITVWLKHWVPRIVRSALRRTGVD